MRSLLIEQLAHQHQGRPFNPARLDQQIEDLTLLVDGTPQVPAPAGDPHDHLVEVPSVARPRLSPPHASRDPGTEFEHPAPDRFVGQIEPACGKKFLAVARDEADIEPNCVLMMGAGKRWPRYESEVMRHITVPDLRSGITVTASRRPWGRARQWREDA